MAEVLQGLSDFSHVEVLFLFHEVNPEGLVIARVIRETIRSGPQSVSLRSVARTGRTASGARFAGWFGWKEPGSLSPNSTPFRERRCSTLSLSWSSSCHAVKF